MPELPEVESVRLSLLPHILGGLVTSITINRPEIISSDHLRRSGKRITAAHNPAHLLAGDTITALTRRGKQILIAAASGRGIVIHLGMTGQVIIEQASENNHDALARAQAVPHTHILWQLRAPLAHTSSTSAQQSLVMAFRDPRRFGGIILIDDHAAIDTHAWSDLGPDALTITGAHLHAALANSTRSIKAALLDQSTIAGVGNIYADEACFMARLNPRLRCNKLKAHHWETLASAIRQILAQAIHAGGSTLRDYRDANGTSGQYALQHAVYARAGLRCVACPSTLRGERLAGRATVWCPTCQPARLPRSITP